MWAMFLFEFGLLLKPVGKKKKKQRRETKNGGKEMLQKN
jgi:hypothetical protein